jgi:site-specific recombinase XerD
MQKAIKGAAEKAGLAGQVSGHVLRNSFAMHLLAEGNDISRVQAMLGLSDKSMTLLYNHLLQEKGQDTV